MNDNDQNERISFKCPSDKVDPLSILSNRIALHRQLVWFLAGSRGAPVFRNCDIPAGKALMFAPLESECSTAEDSTLKTEDQMRSCAVNAI